MAIGAATWTARLFFSGVKDAWPLRHDGPRLCLVFRRGLPARHRSEQREDVVRRRRPVARANQIQAGFPGGRKIGLLGHDVLLVFHGGHPEAGERPAGPFRCFERSEATSARKARWHLAWSSQVAGLSDTRAALDVEDHCSRGRPQLQRPAGAIAPCLGGRDHRPGDRVWCISVHCGVI